MLFKHLVFVFLFVMISFFTSAQQLTVKGKVIGKNGLPIEYINVLLLTDTIKTQETTTDRTGNFSLSAQKGNYTLQLKQFGKDFLKVSISLLQDVDLGDIKIDETQVLKEVTVNARKNLYERKVDRMVFNVENSVFSSGTNVLEVLNNTPLVSANDRAIAIVGKGTVQIMVDDRLIQISGQDLISYLRSLPSDNISKIEVITSPPAKYDASGNAGLINIITKKAISDVFSANITSGFTRNSKESYDNNISLNYKKNKLQGMLKFRQTLRNAKVFENQNINFYSGGALNNNTDRSDNFRNLGINLDLSYKTSKRNTSGLLLDIGRGRNTYNSETQTSYLTNGILDSLLITSSAYSNPMVSRTLSLYDDWIIDSTGSKVGFVFNYFSNEPSTSLTFETRGDTTSSRTLNTSDFQYNVLSGQADFSTSFKQIKIETGIKYTRFNNQSNINYSYFGSSSTQPPRTLNNRFQLLEDNYAGYLSLERKLTDKLEVKTGLRYEYTLFDGSEPEGSTSFKIKYGKLFPNFNLLYKTDNNTYSINYNKRINRPRISQLNPFKWFSNPYVYIVGNPYLQPSIGHNVEFNYLHKAMLGVSLFASRQESAFAPLISVRDGVKETKTENIFTINNLGINLTYNKRIIAPWNLSMNTTAFYSQSKSNLKEVSALKGWSAQYTINNTYTISKKNSWLLFLNFWHALPGIESNVSSRSLTNLVIGTRFNLLKDHLTVSLRAADILKGTVSKGSLRYNTFLQYYSNYYDNRAFNITLTYNIGDIRTSTKKIQFSEQNRAN